MDDGGCRGVPRAELRTSGDCIQRLLLPNGVQGSTAEPGGATGGHRLRERGRAVKAVAGQPECRQNHAASGCRLRPLLGNQRRRLHATEFRRIEDQCKVIEGDLPVLYSSNSGQLYCQPIHIRREIQAVSEWCEEDVWAEGRVCGCLFSWL